MKRKSPPSDMGSTIMAVPSLKSGRRKAQSSQSGGDTRPETTSAEQTQFKIRLANLPGIRREASLLIKERYALRGYNVQDLDEDPHRLTVVAYDEAEPIGTISIGFDSSAGLLCDERYKIEIDKLRASGRKVCEFIKLAVNSSSASVPTLAALFHVAFIYAYRMRGFEDVVMEINPHHLKFYQRALGFRPIGSETINPRVNAPAVLLRCEFSHIALQLKKFGGDVASRRYEKSIYPYGFSPLEEEGILQRLTSMRATALQEK